MARPVVTERIEIRKAPTDAVLALHPQNVRGSCRWCGGVVTERTELRGWLKYWHGACETEYLVCSQPQIARRIVGKRDKGICFDCKALPRTEIREWCGPSIQWTYETETWHVDHKIPLWKVVHLPPLERVEYFKLHNLVTRCEKCHAIKTKEEAAERAHFRRLSEPPKEPKGRPLKSRGFQKHLSKRIDGSVVPR